MKRLFRRSLRRSGKKGHRQTLGRSAPRSGVFRAIGWEQLEGRMLLTAQLVVNTTADDLDGGTVANPSGPDGTLSLREAVTVANLEGGANITFAIPGDSVQNPLTIGLTSALPALGNGITIVGPGTDELTVSGNNQFQIFDVPASSTITISGLTVAHAMNATPAATKDASGNPAVKGGAIVNDGKLTLTSDVVSNNVATTSASGTDVLGGAVFSDGTLTLSNDQFTGDAANNSSSNQAADGGAIFSSGNLTVTNSTFTNNSVTQSNSSLGRADGGAIDSEGTLSLTGSVLSGNTVTGASTGAGGALEVNADGSNTATIFACTFNDNTSSATGSFGTAFGGGIDGSGTVNITDSTISGNTASGAGPSSGTDGGGLDFHSSDSATETAVTIINSTVTGNAATGPFAAGGGFNDEGGDFSQFVNSTVADNSATATTGKGFGGGIEEGDGNDNISLFNTIVAGNTVSSGGTGPDVDGDLTSNRANPVISDHSLIRIGDGSGITNGTSGNQVGTSASPIDPKLGPLQNNGGPTETMALLAGSPAIDAGNNNKALDANGLPLTTDQRGTGFPRIINGTVDIGAFEVLPNLVVNTTADDIDGGTVANPSGPDGTLSLREAITVANLEGGANITFNIPNDSAQKPQTIGLTSALPALGNGITISGPGADELTISGRNQFEVFNVSTGSTVSISGLTLANGFTNTPAKHGKFTFVAGGAISNDGNLTLSDDVLFGNSAAASDTLGLATGGAIINEGTLSISGCSLTANSVSAFAGSSFTAQGGAIDNHGNLTITESTLSGNGVSASGTAPPRTLPTALGGALANVEGGVANITGTTISDNTATGFVVNGAGIFEGVFAGASPSGSLTLIDSTLSGNAGAGTNGQGASGGGAEVHDGKISLLNCTVAGNTVTGPNSAGGGVALSSAQASLINCTVSANAVENSSGGGSGGGIGGGTVNLTNTVVAGNTVDAGGFGPDLALLSVGTDDHNLIGIGGTGSGGLTNGQNGDQVGTAASPLVPKLGPLSNNGGPTQTMALVAGSPAIDAGDNAAVTSPPFANPPTDQRGTGFPRIVNGTVDLGAFEFSPLPNLVVTTTADDLDGGTLANPDGPDGTLSLREAITLANLEGGGIITFNIPGDTAQTPQTITLTSALPALNAAITLAGPGANELTVSGNDHFQPFNVTAGSVVSISGLTIAHGFNNTPALNGGVLPFVAGGAILNSGTLTLTDDVLTNNTATNTSNNGFAAGGAVYNVGTLTVNACTLTDNSVTATTGNTSGAAGGAIDSNGSDFNHPALLTITDSAFNGNSSSDLASGSTGGQGGAVEIVGATSATITGTTISGNTASGGVGEGGGIYDGTYSNFQVNVLDSTISGNTAAASLVGGLAEGGGVNEFGNGPLSLTNCTIANNTVTSADRGVGGGLAVFVSTTTLTNCTVTGNADNFTTVGSGPTSGGGGIWDSGSTFGMTNTIVAGNTEAAGGTGADFSNNQSSGDVVSPDDHNLIGIGDGSGLTNGTHGDQVGTAASSLDAKLGTLANNGGPTQTIALLAGSPAIDAGDNAAITSPPFASPATDQRGSGFPRIINGTVDIGAFEVLPTLVVNTTADDLDGGTIADPSGPDKTLSLREAITVANLEGGAIITFAIPGDSAQNPQTITLASALPAITGTVTITGPGADELTVSGNDKFQVFDVPAASAVSISGLTIAHGFVDAPNVDQAVAGGGVVNQGTLTLTDDTFTNNIATVSTGTTGAGNGGLGGAIFNDSNATLTVDNCTFTGNSASNAAGGEASGGAIENGVANGITGGSCTIDGSSFTNNTAVSTGTSGFPDASGGALGGVLTLNVTASTFSANKATGVQAFGGAISLATSSSLTISGSTFDGNQASGSQLVEGGGIYAGEATLTATDSTIANNTATASAANSRSAGGGIYDNTNVTTLTNCTIAGNSVTGQTSSGGAMDLDFGGLTLTNGTIAGNAAHALSGGVSVGGGVDLDQGAPASNDASAGLTLNLTNTIIATNTVDAGGTAPDLNAAVTTADHNLIGIGDGSSGITNGTGGNQVGTVANPIDPKLAALANNGGPTETMALLAGSPAIDAGDNAAITNPPFPGPPFTDQRAAGFPRILNGTVDIGAFEMQPVTPGTITWTGGSTASSNWSDPANWDLNRAPIDGDSVVFPDENVARTTNTNDLSGLSLNSITFQDEAGGATATPYTIAGDPVTLGAGGIVDGVSGTSSATHIDQLNLDISLGANQTWSMATTPPSTTAPKFELLQLDGTITLGAFNLNLAANTGATNNTFDLKGAVNGAGQISVDMSVSGELYLGHANTYTGGTKVNSGTLLVAADGALGPAPGDGGTTLGDQAVLFVATAYETPEVVTVNGGTVFGFNFGPDSFAGPITFNSSNGKNDLAISIAPFTLQGNVTFGNFDLHAVNEASGASTLIFNGTMSGGGTLQVLTGADFGGANSSGPLTLAGAGTVTAPINVSSGSTLEPGDPNAATTTGTLHAANVTFQSGSTFAAVLSGTAAGQFDQLNSSGTVNLGGAALNVTSAGGFAPGTKIVIVQAANSIIGTFNNLPEGSTVTAGGQNLTISYANDQVTLAAPGVTPGSITWTGKSTTSANWSDPANWDLNRAPVNGDSLVFPATAQHLANNDNLSGLSVNSLTFQGTFTTATGGYTLSGDDLTVGAGGIVDNGSIGGVLSSIDNQVDLNVVLGAAQSWSIDDSDNFHHLTVNGKVTDGGFGLTATGSGTIDIAGQIGGSGSLTVKGQATGGLLTVDLDHANTYTGGTHVNTGILDVFADGALGPGGTNDGGTVVGADGLLFIHGIAYSTPEALTLDGTLGNDGGTSSFAGPITVTGSASGTGNGLPVPVDAQISDTSGGTFTLNGPTLVNNGHADLFVNGGNLSLGGNSTVVIDNTMSGTGGLFVVATAVQLPAANTYQGSTFLGGVAEVDVGIDNAIPSGSQVVMQSGAGNANLVKLAGHSDTIGSLAGTESNGGTNTFDLGTGGSLVTGGDETSTTFAGDITGSGTLTKAGTGTFDLTATNGYTGTTTVDGGTLLVDGSTATGSNVVVATGATLGGAGTVGGLAGVAGTLSPGAGPDPSKDTGSINTGDVVFISGSTFAVQLGGTASSPTSDQLKSSGTVTLSGAQPTATISANHDVTVAAGGVLDLTVLAGAGPYNAGQQFGILQGSSIVGAFTNAPNGSTVNDGVQNFTINYTGTSVTLTVQATVAIPRSLAFGAATFNANETDPSATITLKRTGGSAGAVSVTFATSNGTALAGTDYTTTTQTVSWAAGDTTNKTVTIPLIDDNATGESAQTVSLALSAPTGGATLGSQNTATLDIAEDDDVPSGVTATYLNGQPGDNTAATFVHNLYRELLGREPDSAGQSFWVGLDTQLAGAGTAASAQHSLVAGFLGSPEYREHLVTGMFRDLLDRAPDAGGLQFWTTILAAGTDEKSVLVGILGSDEYYADAGKTASGFVNALYRNVLGRAVDQGSSFWADFFTSPPSFLPPITSLRDFRVGLAEIFLSTPEAEHKLLDGNYPGAAGGVGAPGSPALGDYALADITGNGWDNLYFQGSLSAANVDALFAQLQGGTSFDDTIAGMLDMPQYFGQS